MSNPRNGRRPQQVTPEIYRRRRIVVGVGLLAVIGLIIWIFSMIVGFIGGIFHPAAAASATPTVSANASDACPVGAVSVIAGIGNQSQVSANSFAATETPSLWFQLTNNSANPCTFDAGTAVSSYKITSGSTVIWDSHQCDRSQDASSPIILQPGATVSSQASTWMKVYSSATGCSTGQKAVPTKGASYHLTATVNGVTSSDVQFMLN
ncbi:MAG: hypothetical protein ACKOWJ_05670 [Micrococcales bacterium]